MGGNSEFKIALILSAGLAVICFGGTMLAAHLGGTDHAAKKDCFDERRRRTPEGVSRARGFNSALPPRWSAGYPPCETM